MSGNRPLQYVGLLALIVASIAIIFLPVGPRPTEQAYTIHLAASKPFDKLVGAGKKPGDEADSALLKAFKTDKLPGSLIVSPGTGTSGGSTATIDDHATSRSEAQARVTEIMGALTKVFAGVKSTDETGASIEQLPATPIFSVGTYAVFPPKTRDGKAIPAIKLGLDLQGGVNLVLQVRRALFTYTFDKKLSADNDVRDSFVAQVRAALDGAPDNLKLIDANVNLVPGSDNQLEVRTQAADKAEFDAQRKGIIAALAGVKDVKFSEARDPQFFVPDEKVSQQYGTASTYSKEMLDRTVEIIRARVDKLGVSEPLIQEQGTDRVIVQLPGVNDPQKAVDVIGKTAQMELRLLPQDIQAFPDPTDSSNWLFRDSTGFISADQAKQRSKLMVSGADMQPTATVFYGEDGTPAVHFDLQNVAATKFGIDTQQNVGRMMPIFLDERCIEAPVIRSAITGGSGEISGGFKTLDDARALALLLNSGALPAPIDVVENRTISATLGADSLVKSLKAGLIGIGFVILFMLGFYRLPGLLADFALVIYCIVNLAVFILIGGTLTLPGIAGFMLAIAMSLDTNILVFERLREEMEIQPSFSAALRAAFSRAWTAILDSHVTTLIAAAVLFNLGTGPVKGFALTLGIGVLLSLFSAISVTRLFMWSIAHVGEKNHNLFASGVRRAATLVTAAK